MDISQLYHGNTQEMESEVESLQYFGYIKGTIVGIRYYTGMVSNKEMVALVREPHNPYDCNAVRVNNILGQQVGHIKKEMARALAEVVDQGLASIEGLVPYGANNTYSMAVEISFWGDLRNADRTAAILRRHGYCLTTGQPKVQNSPGNYGSQQKYTAAKRKATRITSDQMKSELDGLFEKLKEVDQTIEEDGCPAIKSTLYKHQKQALSWMRKREGGSDLPPFWEERKPNAKEAAKAQGRLLYHNSVMCFSTFDEPKKVKGGILADDMGLGKTLITISVILGNSWNGKPIHRVISTTGSSIHVDTVPHAKSEMTSTPGNQKQANSDVIVIDDDDDEQDKIKQEKVVQKPEDAEVSNKFTEKISSTKAGIKVNGEPKEKRSNRATKRPAYYRDEPEIEKDEIEKKPVSKKSKRKKSRGKSSEVDEEYVPTEKLRTPHLNSNKLNDPVKAERMEDRSTLQFERETAPGITPHVTLIVCPLSLIGGWLGQIDEHVHPNAEVKTLVYHGPMKSQVTEKLLNSVDVVITTYQTLAQKMKRFPNSLLFKTNWLRVVLDEGHMIRNQRAQQTKACCALKTERKWILTGTPIQNSTKDLFSLVSFLGIEPFTERQWWTRTIERPISDGDPNALKRIRCLLGSICMRRTKKQKINGKPIITMPPKDIFLQKIDMDEKERELYNKMDRASKNAMKTYISEGLHSSNYADMLVFIMRLRQICCHPILAKDALETLNTGGVITKEVKELATKLLCLLETGSLDDCCVCLDSITMPVMTKCSHVFCKLCICGVIANNIRTGVPSRCPLCRNDVREEDLVEPPPENTDIETKMVSHDQQSSKVNALMYILLKLKKKEPDVKSLVVSQFAQYLKLIQSHLVNNNIPCVLYHGGMTRKAREDAIWQLQYGHAKVMLLTLKAGGVGLNLTAASQVFLMEPSWNPAAEDQCFDRVYRLGQDKPVKIVKFVCTNTVEERVLELQTRKRELAKASLQRRTAEERKQQTIDDLRKLMDF